MNAFNVWPMAAPAALVLATIGACGGDRAETSTSAQATSTAPAAAPLDAPPDGLPAPPPDAPRAGTSRIDIQMEGNTIIPSGGPSTDPFSVVDVEITAPAPLRFKLRVQPALAPGLADELMRAAGSGKGERSFSLNEMDGQRIGAKLMIAQTSFTVAGRPIDVAGGRLHVCGVDLGKLATGAVVTLAPGEVRVDDVFRGALPAPIATR